MAYVDRQGLSETDVAETSPASVGDYFALLKPRVMSLVVFTALTGMAMAPGGIHPILAFASLLAIAVGAGAAGALNMWYDADIDRVMRRTRGRPVPMERVTPGEALGLRADAVGRRGHRAGLRRQLPGGGAARFHDLLLRRRLHDVAEALDAAEHRDRRRRRRAAPGDRVDRGDRHDRLGEPRPLRHHLPVDPTAFLGARALQGRRIRARRRADAAGCRRRRRGRGGRFSSIP